MVNLNKFGHLKILFVEITDTCTFDCIHCYNGDSRTNNILEISTFKEILHKITQKYIVESIQITGGEVMTLPNIAEYVQLALRYAPHVEIFTNGSIRPPKQIYSISAKYLSFAVSFYSLNKEEYWKITKNKNITPEQILSHIHNLRQKGYFVRVETPLVLQKKASIVALKKYFAKLKIPHRVTPLLPIGRAKTVALYQNRGVATYTADLDTIVKISKKYDFCWATHLCISTKGDVYPCPFARNHNLGNIIKNSVTDIYKMHKQISREYRADTLQYCKMCPAKYICKRCPVRREMALLKNICEPHCYKLGA